MESISNELVVQCCGSAHFSLMVLYCFAAKTLRFLALLGAGTRVQDAQRLQLISPACTFTWHRQVELAFLSVQVIWWGLQIALAPEALLDDGSTLAPESVTK